MPAVHWLHKVKLQTASTGSLEVVVTMKTFGPGLATNVAMTSAKAEVAVAEAVARALKPVVVLGVLSTCASATENTNLILFNVSKTE